MTRDAQKDDVYTAEFGFRDLLDSFKDSSGVAHVLGSTVTLDKDRRFGDLDSVQRYVNRVLGLGDVVDRWEKAITPVFVRERKGARYAHYETAGSVIAIPSFNVRKGTDKPGWAMREIVVLHETSHHLSPKGEAHGAEFVGTFIALTEIVMGPEAGFALRAFMYEQNVKIKELVGA